MSLDLSDSGHEVDGSSGNNHSGLAREGSGGGSVDLLGGDGVDLVAVLVEGEVAEGLEVAGNLFESLFLSLHGHEDVHLEDVLSTGELDLRDGLTESVELLKEDTHELSGVGARSFDVETEETGVSEVGVDGRGGVNEVVTLHEAGHSSAVHSLSWATRGEGGGGSDEGVHDVESGHVLVAPGDGLEGEGDVGLRGLSPGSVLSTNVLGGGSLVLVLGDGEHVSESLLDEVDVLTVVSDTGGDDEALLGGDVVHDELLEAAGIEVADVALKTESGHTKGVVSVGGSEEELLVLGEGIVLGEVLGKIVALLVLGAGDVSGHQGAGLKSAISEDLEHIDGIVLDAVTLEVHALLIVVHSEVTTRHLLDTVVHGLVGVLEGLEVGVLDGEEGTGGLSGLITSTDIDQKA